MQNKSIKEQAVEDATESLIMILGNSFSQGETADAAHRLFGIVYDMGFEDGQEAWYLTQDKDENWIKDNSDEFSCVATGNLKSIMHLLFPVGR